MASSKKAQKIKLLPSLMTGIGLGLLILSSVILFRLFRAPIKHEITYIRSTMSRDKGALTPPNTEFAIMIPKIGATAGIVQGVNPYNSVIYQRALTQGIAHAEGTGVPGGGKNIFLFAHSSEDLLTATRFNSVFYLLHHLESGDEIKIWYQDLEHKYLVTESKLVAPDDISYLTKQTDQETLTLMTCWPPGTTLKRLIVIAKPQEI